MIDTEQRRVEMTIIGGRLGFLAGEAAHRFGGRIAMLEMLAG
ncbi:MAG: hypothetical protein WCD16_01905 [Paracoccaceae bacterium]